MMKNTMKKAMTICLIAAMALSAFGCSKEKNQEIPVETISLDQTKQELTFDFKTGFAGETDDLKHDAVEATETDEETAAETTTAAPAFEEVTQVVNVTDNEGQSVTDASGETVTEVTVVETRPLQTEGTSASETSAGETGGGATPVTATTAAAPDPCLYFYSFYLLHC